MIRVAAFGAGWVTTERHIPAMRAHGGFDVVALVDRNPERARAEAERLEVPHAVVAESVDDPSLPEVDAVTCGTAPFAHYAIVRSALEAGKPVITEKPFVMTVNEGEDLVELAGERSIPLAVVHNFQFASSTQKVRRWIADGRLGRLRGVWAFQLSNPARRLPTWFDDLPLGLFYDESPHLLYLVRALAGSDELERVNAVVHPSTRGLANTPAQIDVQLRAGGMPITLLMNFEAPLSEWQVLVFGDEGIAALDVFRDIAVWVPNDKAHRTLDVFRTSLAATFSHWGGYPRPGWGHLRKTLRYGNEEVFARFHDAAARGAELRDISGKDALDVLRLQHWIVDCGS
jgi:predicted dehydrogenase